MFETHGWILFWKELWFVSKVADLQLKWPDENLNPDNVKFYSWKCCFHFSQSLLLHLETSSWRFGAKTTGWAHRTTIAGIWSGSNNSGHVWFHWCRIMQQLWEDRKRLKIQSIHLLWKSFSTLWRHQSSDSPVIRARSWFNIRATLNKT